MIRQVCKPAKPEAAGDPLYHVVKLQEAEYSSLAEEKLDRLSNLLIYQARHSSQPCLVLDLSKVQFIGARFIGVLVAVRDTLRKQDRRLVLRGVTPYCSAIIGRLGLDRLFEMR